MVDLSANDFIAYIVTAAFRGSKNVRIAIGIGLSLFACGIPLLFVGKTDLPKIIGGVIAGTGLLALSVVYALDKVREIQQQQAKIELVEKKAEDNPEQPTFAWEAARRKLESYLNRNLSQVRSIFLLTNIVMGAGFVLIGVGAFQAFEHPEKFKASVLSTISGVVVTFIGGTFLVLYKATMAQAKDYVTILERINAVGMSIQILELLDEQDKALKHRTMANVASRLLQMYAGGISTPPVQRRKARSRGAAH